MTQSEHPVELELKYRADDATPLQALAAIATLGPTRLGPPETVDELDRYLDTPDLLLAAAHWACRLRTRGGRTTISLKGPARHAAAEALHQRFEVEGPGGSGIDPEQWLPSPAREVLLQLAGGRAAAETALAERFTLAQRRTERAVLSRGRQVGLLSLDESTVLQDGAPRGTLFMVELELEIDQPLDEPLAAELDAALAAVPGIRADPLTKLEHALALLVEPT